MCGRFVLTLPTDALARLFDAAPGNDLPDLPNWNICPTDRVHAVSSAGGRRRIEAMRWGFIPHWAKSETDGPLLINARAETLAAKPAFREAARTRRCLIPADGFYEWTRDDSGGRDPWFIRREDEAPIAFAGLWQDWRDTRSCAIVTTAAAGRVARLHHRMPVILSARDWPLWLGEAGHGAARLMDPAAAPELRFHRVSRAVNGNRATGPELIAPVDA